MMHRNSQSDRESVDDEAKEVSHGLRKTIRMKKIRRKKTKKWKAEVRTKQNTNIGIYGFNPPQQANHKANAKAKMKVAIEKVIALHKSKTKPFSRRQTSRSPRKSIKNERMSLTNNDRNNLWSRDNCYDPGGTFEQFRNNSMTRYQNDEGVQIEMLQKGNEGTMIKMQEM